MNMNFSNWFEAMSQTDVRRARKGMEKSWKQNKHNPHPHRQFKKFEAGTFGLELEFRVESEEGDRHYSEEQLEAIKDELADMLYSVIWGKDARESQLATDWQRFMEDKNPEYESIDDWEYDNDEPEKPDEDDYEDDDMHAADEKYKADVELWEDEHEEWKEKRDVAEAEIDKFDHEELQKEFIKEIMDGENWDDYEVESGNDYYMSSFEDKADEYKDVLEDLGWAAEIEEEDTGAWNIHRDGDGICELTSPIMTLKDIGALTQLFRHVQDETTDGQTSCHIHVGMPKDTDGFDLVAMTTLADEAHLTRDLPGRDFQSFAKFNSDLQYVIGNKLKEGDYSKEEFMAAIKNRERTGTNISAFNAHGTVEFRYLSSDVVDDPDMVLGWVNYFLTLPRIARGRKQIKIGEDGYAGITYLTRIANGGVRVEKSPDGKVKQEPGSPEDLRRTLPINDKQKKMAELRLRDVTKYVEKMRVDHFLAAAGFTQVVMPFVYQVLTSMRQTGEPKTKEFLSRISGDPHLQNYNNITELGKQFTMGEFFRYSDDPDRFRNVAVAAANKNFKVTRQNVEGWKKHL
jgi:hypothetical protein